MLSAPGLVPLARPGAAGLGPAAVAVEHDADVARDGRGAELPGEAAGVGGIQDIAQPHCAVSSRPLRSRTARSRTARPTLLP